VIALLLLACSGPPPAPAPPDHAAHAQLFERAWLQPAPDVHVAVGYALANVIVLEGPTGLVVVDTTESAASAREVLTDLRARTDKPIAALVLTHNHADHVFGGEVFTGGDATIPVYAHRDTEAGINRVVNVLRDTIFVRSARMFGAPLTDAERLHAGIGGELRFDIADVALARPTDVFDDERTIEAGGLTLRLLHMPGETDDQLAVWWPERKVLLPADNIYQTFPNLYTIRGTPYRDVRVWVRSLDAMRDLGAEVLVPQHTRPLVGAAAIEEVLTVYRDAIQYVQDQTVRHMNLGLGPDDLVAAVQLPVHLRDHPWLVEQCGRVSWSVRSVFDGYLGWFDGDPTTLEPLDPDTLAQRWSEALDAGKPLPEATRAAVAGGDLAWASELLRHWRRLAPDDPEPAGLLADVLERRARSHHNPNAMHWYQVVAHELRGDLEVSPPPTNRAPVSLVDDLPIEAFFAGMSTRLKAEEALDRDQVARFEFTDTNRTFTLHLRRGVAEIREREVDAELVLRTTEVAFKRIASKHSSAAAAVATGELEIEGGLAAAVSLLGLFAR
jgi:alkyl sulfatase BDS1-like metallo-beta-lactamase superfamily hydrolase